MNDMEIRAALQRRVFGRYQTNPQVLILSELGLRHGAARIDFLLVNGMLHGFEIKSDRDTLSRLLDQRRVFNSTLDRVTLVVGYRHAGEAMNLIPDWWGVKLASKGRRGGIQFSDARSPRNNPSPDIQAVAKLLWRDEALALLEEMGAATGVYSKPRTEVYARLVESASPEIIRNRVFRQFRCRTNWRSGEQRTSCGG